MGYLLEVRDLTVTIRVRAHTRPVVQGISFGVNAGEALGLVGESGCGKSMTLKALLGILPTGARIASGSIWYDGTCVADATSSAGLRRLRGNGIGLVFQDSTSALDPVMRVGQQISEGLRRHQGLSRRAAGAEAVETLRRLGLPNPALHVVQFPHELSGGMRQRAMLGMATACRPRVLLCDEPTTALDVTSQRRVLELIGQIQRSEGMALIFVSHDLAVIAETCTQVAVMYRGQIIERGAVADVFSRPMHAYTLGLLGAVPDIESDNPGLLAIPGEIPGAAVDIPGCQFHPRCALAVDRCKTGEFPLQKVGPDRESACIRASDVTRLGPGGRPGD